jgi:hypothetical protein
MRLSLNLFLALTITLSAFAGDPAPIEDHNFGLESGWNRDDAVLQYSSFFLRDTAAFELTHEWAARSPRHQLSYTIPVYSHGGMTGLGDARLNYRFQFAGDARSRFGVAPRVSLLLPTRSAHFGERSGGVEVSVPVSAALTPRLTSHTNLGATWFRDLEAGELTAAQGLSYAISDRIALAIDAAWKRCSGGSQMLVVRPGVQFGIDLGGLRVSPGVAYAHGQGALFTVAVEQSLP